MIRLSVISSSNPAAACASTQNQRIRDVRQGPDGAIYLLTMEGSLLRLVPRS
jgi:glucose/arabinose dehydrogenase